MKKTIRITLYVFLAVIVTASVSILYFVWPPDIFSKSEHVVAEANFDGAMLKVTQDWNHVDFYSTGLTYEDSKLHAGYMIDGDDIKRWSCQFVRSGNRVKIMFGDAVSCEYDLKEKRLYRNGDLVGPNVLSGL